MENKERRMKSSDMKELTEEEILKDYGRVSKQIIDIIKKAQGYEQEDNKKDNIEER